MSKVITFNSNGKDITCMKAFDSLKYPCSNCNIKDCTCRETFEYKSYIGSIKYESETNSYHGRILNIPAFVNYTGKNLSELERNFQEAVEDYLETIKFLKNMRKNTCNNYRKMHGIPMRRWMQERKSIKKR